MKYKVGDIVKLRDDLEEGEYYGGIHFMEGMNYLKNKAIDIEECFEELTGDWYKVVDNWGITDEMIEGLWEECKSSEQVEKYNEHTLDALRYAVESKLEGKYKLIDILNKIANGELKEGIKVIWDEVEYTYQDKYLTRKDGMKIFMWADLCNLNDEVELIEPQGPTECEHEWAGYSLGRLGGRTEYRRRCKICGIDEEEPIDNTMEKIEELEWNRFNTTDKIFKKIVFDKLNKVIREFNKIQNVDK